MFTEMFFIDNNGNSLRKSHTNSNLYGFSFPFILVYILWFDSFIKPHTQKAGHTMAFHWNMDIDFLINLNRIEWTVTQIWYAKKRNVYLASRINIYVVAIVGTFPPPAISILIWWMQFFSTHIYLQYLLGFSKPC